MTKPQETISTIPAPSIEYWVQCSKQPNAKAGYITRRVAETEVCGWVWYNSLNIGYGYKKRLVAYSPIWGKKILARSAS